MSTSPDTTPDIELPPVDGVTQLGHGRCAQDRLLGQHVALLLEPLQGRRDRRHLRRLAHPGAAICDGSAVVGTASAVEREVTPDLHRVREP